MKKLLFILPLIAAYLYYLLPQQIVKQKQKIDINQELKKRVNKKYIEESILESIDKREYEEAKSFIALAKNLKIEINPNLEKRLKDKESSVDEYINKGKDFFNGFFSGKASNSATLAGSVTSDFTVVGDLRDVYKEGKLYINNQPYDKFILSLSIIGLGLSAATLSSFGSSAFAKVGVSILKAAKRSKALTKSFTKVIAKKLDKSINLRVLKNANFSSLKGIEKSTKEFSKSINLKPIKALFKDLNRLKKNTSTIQSIKILKYIDNEKELAKAVKISSKYKKSTLALFKTLGKGVFRSFKFIIKKTALYIPILVGLLLSTLLWIGIAVKLMFKSIFS